MNSETNGRKLTEHKLHFNLFASNSLGIVVVRESSCPTSDLKMENIIPGNLTKMSFTFNDKKYIIHALYSIRKDDVEFFKKVFLD